MIKIPAYVGGIRLRQVDYGGRGMLHGWKMGTQASSRKTGGEVAYLVSRKLDGRITSLGI